MEITGIICEYNPLHQGHKKQIGAIRRLMGKDSGIVCLMSGNFVQRGAPAIVDKQYRARAAILSGADLVLELPVTYALSSAEGFAAGGVGILSPFCDYLCFGAETANPEVLMTTAAALLSADFSVALREKPDRGVSFPAARQAALEGLGLDGSILSQPNNILAVEYCKAILAQGSSMKPIPITREGGYHDTRADSENPSATAVRSLMLSGGDWDEYVPEEVRECFRDASLHTLTAGERAILARLRTMTEAEFEALPYGSEGLWRKFMHACREEATLESIIAATKSKRYTRTRIDRMVMCAFLELTEGVLSSPASYARVLAFNEKGRELLKISRKYGNFPNIGERLDSPYQEIEDRCGDLYGLFAADGPEAPGIERKRRVFYCRESNG